MTDPDQTLADLEEITAYIAEHHHRIPAHRRAQAIAQLERIERLIPTPPTPQATNGQGWGVTPNSTHGASVRRSSVLCVPDSPAVGGYPCPQ